MVFTVTGRCMRRVPIAPLSVVLLTRYYFTTVNAPAASASPIIEIGTNLVQPEAHEKYLRKLSRLRKLRDSDPRLSHLRLLSLVETGAGSLDSITSVSFYTGGYAELESNRKVLAQWQEWQKITESMNKYIRDRSSTIWIEAPFITSHVHPAVHGLATIPDPNTLSGDAPMFEFRRYNLKLGYDTVPQFLNLYEAGLDSKLEHQDPTTSLVTVLYTEVGRLNQVLEIWRHGNGALAMQTSRQASRQAPTWRDAIAQIANLALEFESNLQKPLFPSPIR